MNDFFKEHKGLVTTRKMILLACAGLREIVNNSTINDFENCADNQYKRIYLTTRMSSRPETPEERAIFSLNRGIHNISQQPLLAYIIDVFNHLNLDHEVENRLFHNIIRTKKFKGITYELFLWNVNLADKPAFIRGPVEGLLKKIYDERQFDVCPILADALEDHGCEGNDEFIVKLRTEQMYRGSYILDLLLKREAQ